MAYFPRVPVAMLIGVLASVLTGCTALPGVEDASVDEADANGGHDASVQVDGGSDSGWDAGAPFDAGSDAGADAGANDGGTDGGPSSDGGPSRDGGADAGRDAGADAGRDGGTDAGRLVVSDDELIFSGVRGTTLPPQSIVATNIGGRPLQVSAIAVAGAYFTISGPSLPITLGPGQTTTVAVTFAPSTTVLGSLSASLNFTSSAGSPSVGLYGLATRGQQGTNEPSLDSCVQTLGYAIDVGGTGLILGTGATPIGDEVIHPLFHKADAGVVTMKAVARYSPNETLPFGWYLPGADGGVSVHHLLGTIALNQEQTLNPGLIPDSGTTFDPGTATFGLYVSSNTFNRNTYTQEALNTGPTVHASRVYPLKDRQGRLVPNAYLIGFEDAANGDYQDYVFVLTNVAP